MSDNPHGKHVAIVGNIQGFDGKADEVWTVNMSFGKQLKDDWQIDRVFFLHNPGHLKPQFSEQLNELPDHVRVICRKKWEQIPRCEQFDLPGLIKHFAGIQYFTSTASYMVAQAIREGFGKITLSGLYYIHDSTEYVLAKSCMEFWMGIAIGCGVEISQNAKSMLMRPHPWASRTYAYKVNTAEQLSIQTMACAYRASLGYPVQFKDPDDLSAHEFLTMNKMAKMMNHGIEGDALWVDREPNTLPKERQLELTEV